jgi:hypothetical protein
LFETCVKIASGKLAIIGIVAVAVGAASVSWWFRFSATRDAVRFWGPDAAAMIRDAPHVTLIAVEPQSSQEEAFFKANDGDRYSIDNRLFKVTSRWNVSQANGLTHLRNALLEDRSFVSTRSFLPQDWATGLEFRKSAESPPLVVLISSGHTTLIRHWPGHGSNRLNQCDAIEEGLKKTFCEWSDGQLCGN